MEASKEAQTGLRKIKVTRDADRVDDKAEEAGVLMEWLAFEDEYRPKTPLWFAGLAAGATVLVALQLIFFTNAFGAAAIAMVGALIYIIAQRKPAKVKYRLMADGIAMNNLLYQWQDLQSFNVIYQPGETKTVIFKSKRRFLPYLHLEIGDTDPVRIRDILLEFLPEDEAMREPMADVIARRLGF
jgi:hypothetical protein